MSSKVWFIPAKQLSSNNSKKERTRGASRAARELMEAIINDEKIPLEKEVPLKVHFGEKGNNTYIKPETYNGIIDCLEEKNIASSFIETNVMYQGERLVKPSHIKLAKEHGFTRLPVIIADGHRGEEFYEVEIGKKHFQTCKLGKEFSRFNNIIVLSHFKGHMIAGFGGAIKQLAMGFASRGGKVAQHLNAKPFILPFLCRKCGACLKHCPENAINLGFIPHIDRNKCVGCAACTAICPQKAIKLNMFRAFGSMGNVFGEKLAEYAYAAQKGKKFIYINFALDITPGCDCEGRAMEPVLEDLGVFASTDAVAIDRACWDKAAEKGKMFKGEAVLKYAESIGLGSQSYEIIALNGK